MLLVDITGCAGLYKLLTLANALRSIAAAAIPRETRACIYGLGQGLRAWLRVWELGMGLGYGNWSVVREGKVGGSCHAPQTHQGTVIGLGCLLLLVEQAQIDVLGPRNANTGFPTPYMSHIIPQAPFYSDVRMRVVGGGQDAR
ncbi:MAG: hypothetical protein FRX49_02584 [Trebouxia sp. A1-2]|nr:MAG: hypothetical protein FRX49_02584 [Trebouxia sp. A1-2]